MFTEAELAELRQLDTQLHDAVPHSQEAVAIGKAIAEVYRKARIRNNPPNPTIDKMMRRLSRKIDTAIHLKFYCHFRYPPQSQ